MERYATLMITFVNIVRKELPVRVLSLCVGRHAGFSLYRQLHIAKFDKPKPKPVETPIYEEPCETV